MNILMISTDRSVFNKESAFRARLFEYQKHLGHITVLVLGIRGEEDIAPEIRAIGVLRKTKLGTLRAAYLIARSLSVSDPVAWLVTTQDEFTGLIGYFLRRRLGVVWRAEVHTDILSPWFGRVFLKNNIRKLVFRLTIPRASGIRVVSERIKRSLQKARFVRAPIAVLPVKPTRFAVADPAGSDRFFIVLSRLTHEKNITSAIRAFKKIADIFPEVLLKIVGDGPEKTVLEHLASSLGIRNRIVFLGWQNNVQSLLAGSLGLVSTSWYEGFGLSILEAMSVGCPVITTDVGIAGDILKHEVSGIVVEHNDADAIADAMALLIKDPEYRLRLTRAAKDAVAPFFDEDVYWRAFDESFSICKTVK
jgi:glycosyltransferase involved in cell wall biosynthesis